MKQFLNVHGRLCKVAIVALTLMFMTSFAQVSLNVGIDARVRGVLNSGVNAISGNYYDAAKVTLGATIDNVTATVVLSRNSDSGSGQTAVTDITGAGVIVQNSDFGNFIKFDSFTLEVKDLFSGLLSAKFYNWDFGAGKSNFDDNQLLSDIGLVGAYFNVQPIDIFGFGIGYGVRGLSPVGGAGRNTAHAIKFNTGIGGPVPVNVYFGTVLTHGYTATLQAADDGGLVTRTRPFGVERMQVGVDADFYQGWIKASVGFTLPVGAAVSYIKSPTDLDVGRDFVLVGGVDGKIPFGDTGLSLEYAAYYATESYAKALPNALDSDLHDNLDGVMFKAAVKPVYSLGIFAVSLNIGAFMQEVWTAPTVAQLANANVQTIVNNLIDAGVANNDASTAQIGYGAGLGGINAYVKPTTGPRNPLGIELEPKVTITFAPGMSVDLLYVLSMTELSDRAAGVDSATTRHTIGMNVKAAFGYTAE